MGTKCIKIRSLCIIFWLISNICALFTAISYKVKPFVEVFIYSFGRGSLDIVLCRDKIEDKVKFRSDRILKKGKSFVICEIFTTFAVIKTIKIDTE